jgi:hypothetical protein
MTTECDPELRAACLELARALLWTATGPSADVVETLASKIEDRGIPYAEYLQSRRADPLILGRAMRYHALHLARTPGIHLRTCTECVVGGCSQHGQPYQAQGKPKPQ